MGALMGQGMLDEEVAMSARVFRVLRTVLWVSIALVGVGLATLLLAFPRSQPAAELTIEPTPERLERGRYLVEHVANCLDCHSERDWSYYGGPVVRGTEGQGAALRVLRPHIQSANITPPALGEWSDGEIVRAITSGIGRDGRALNPFMPYDTYARMIEGDVYSLVSYLRTLPPIENDVPRPEESWPIRLIGRVLPRPYVAPEAIDRGVTAAYGRYLVEIAECGFCHGADFSGGRMFQIPGTSQKFPSENITPHPSNRIGAWSRENFVGVFRSFAPPGGREIPGHEINTVMPWSRYAGMSEDDLGAIYEYLRTIEPVEQDEPE
ncbi:MAG: cytochrome C [Acidobacteria bacterium]|nr:cytochrome C [Acidobacteriota bacterium]